MSSTVEAARSMRGVFDGSSRAYLSFRLPTWFASDSATRGEAGKKIDAFIMMQSDELKGFAVRFEAISLYSKLLSGKVPTHQLSKEIDILLCKQMILLGDAWKRSTREELLNKCNLVALDDLIHSRLGTLDLSKEFLESHYLGTDVFTRGQHYGKQAASKISEAVSSGLSMGSAVGAATWNGMKAAGRFAVENPELVRGAADLAHVLSSSRDLHVHVHNEKSVRENKDPIDIQIEEKEAQRARLIAAGDSTEEVDAAIARLKEEKEKKERASKVDRSSLIGALSRSVVAVGGTALAATAYSSQQQVKVLDDVVERLEEYEGTAADGLMPANSMGRTYVAKQYLDFLIADLTNYLCETMKLSHDDPAVAFVESMKFDLRDAANGLHDLRERRVEFIRKQNLRDSRANYSWMLTGVAAAVAAVVPKRFRWIPAAASAAASTAALWFSLSNGTDAEERKDVLGIAAMELERFGAGEVSGSAADDLESKEKTLKFIKSLADDFEGSLEDKDESIVAKVGRGQEEARNLLLEALRKQMEAKKAAVLSSKREGEFSANLPSAPTTVPSVSREGQTRRRELVAE